MNAIVTNDHHFSKGVTLTIKDGKSIWSVDQPQQKYKYGTGVFGKQNNMNGDTTLVLDPENSIDDFVRLINLVFEFTGTLTVYEEYNPTHYMVPNNLRIKSDESLSQWDIVKHIYDTPLEHHLRFIRIGHCGCNMGNCGEIIGYNIDDNNYKTYGDLMKMFGDNEKDSKGNIYYNYPDSVWLFLEKICELPEKVHVGTSCSSEKVVVTQELNKDEIYLSWSYGR